MPVTTRSMENILNLEEPANVSFTVSSGTEYRIGSNQRNQLNRALPRTPTNIRPNNNLTEENNSVSENHNVRELISESVESLRSELTTFISTELRTLINGATNANRPASSNINLIDITTNSPNRRNENRTPTTGRSSNNSEPFLAEKVTNIIRNWRIKFTGFDSQIPVDEFIYRVNIMTTNDLQGNFNLLLNHGHCLFEGKALTWFWRYHKQNYDDMDWISLANALRHQYKVDYSDFDILNDIRSKRQKSNEKFDDYLDAISALTDRLRTPISDRDLCDTIIRNLKSEVRYELLHLNISTVSQLRREVRKHEKFVEDLSATEQRRSMKGRVSEICKQADTLDLSDENDDFADICAVQHKITCWNCDKIGHTFFDCMEIRKVFCYGCGIKDTYKPNCPNCKQKSAGNGSRDVRRK